MNSDAPQHQATAALATEQAPMSVATPSPSEEAKQEIPVEDLFNGVVNVLGDGLEVVIDGCMTAHQKLAPHAEAGYVMVCEGIHEGIADMSAFMYQKLYDLRTKPKIDDIEIIQQIRKENQTSQPAPVQGS
ncbi:hypothetical protein [Terasakiella sp. SH-1]|uniref:hypothetical protein n=1 Tax=Terasakiella sp. SH-1 TaxID=2560057 RepID=UPI001073D778|nr:hypothetical protein [Terasakiella sp. SH-1]